MQLLEGLFNLDILFSFFPPEIGAVIAIGIFAMGFLWVNHKLQQRLATHQQILVSLIFTVLLLIIFFLVWKLGVARSNLVLYLLLVLFAGVMAFFSFLPGANPVSRAVGGKLTETRTGLLGWLDDNISRRWRVLIAMICVVLIIAIPVVSFSLRPEPFRVIIEQSPPAGQPESPSGSLHAMLMGLEQDLDGDKLDIVLSPRDNNADLAITITLQNSECSDKPNRWRWNTVEGSDLGRALTLFLVNKDGPRKELSGDLCDWSRLKDDLKALIYLAHGLNAYYMGQTDEERQMAPASFDEAYNSMSDNPNGPTSYRNLADDSNEEYLELPRRIHTCAQVMSAVTARWPIEDDGRRDRLSEVIHKDPYGTGAPPPDLCVAQAHFWLGRDAMEQHLKSLEAGDATVAAGRLHEAITHFDNALNQYAAMKGRSITTLDRGPQWVYHFYRALAHYRLGDTGNALNDLRMADEQFAALPLNESPRETISYLCARLWMETSVYPSWAEQICEIRPQERPGFENPFDALRYMQQADGFGLAPLSIGTMSLFYEAQYWEAMARCQEEASSPAEAAHCVRGGPGIEPPCDWGASEPARRTLCPRAGTDEGLQPNCRWRETPPHLANPGDCFRVMAVDKSEAASSTNLGDTPGRGRLPDPSPIDVYSWMLYDLQGSVDVSLSEDTRKTFLVNAGVPAYVIPLQPWPDRLTNAPIELDNGPLVFEWLLRNRYDEPVFDMEWPADRDADSSDGSCSDLFTFCLELRNDADKANSVPLSDRGLGLFVSEPVSIPVMELVASPGLTQTIELDGDLSLSLSYKLGEDNSHSIAVGSLPLTTVITNDELTAEATVQYIGQSESLAEDPPCLFCYDYRVIVDAQIILDTVEIAGLKIETKDNLPSLTFWATLWEVSYVPSDLYIPGCQKNWPRTNAMRTISLEWDEEKGNFVGAFPRMTLDTQKYYSVHVYAQDSQGNQKINTWDCNIKVRAPE